MKLKDQINIEIAICRQTMNLSTSSSEKKVCEQWLQSLQHIEHICKERNRY